MTKISIHYSDLKVIQISSIGLISGVAVPDRLISESLCFTSRHTVSMETLSLERNQFNVTL